MVRLMDFYIMLILWSDLFEIKCRLQFPHIITHEHSANSERRSVLYNLILNSKTGKAPGSEDDYLETIKLLSDDIIDVLVKLFNEIYELDHISQYLRRFQKSQIVTVAISFVGLA